MVVDKLGRDILAARYAARLGAGGSRQYHTGAACRSGSSHTVRQAGGDYCSSLSVVRRDGLVIYVNKEQELLCASDEWSFLQWRFRSRHRPANAQRMPRLRKIIRPIR